MLKGQKANPWKMLDFGLGPPRELCQRAGDEAAPRCWSPLSTLHLRELTSGLAVGPGRAGAPEARRCGERCPELSVSGRLGADAGHSWALCSFMCVCRQGRGVGRLTSTQEPGVLSRHPVPPPPQGLSPAASLSSRSAPRLCFVRLCSNCSFTSLSPLQTVCALGQETMSYFSLYSHSLHRAWPRVDSLYLLDGWVGWVDGRKEGRMG